MKSKKRNQLFSLFSLGIFIFVILSIVCAFIPYFKIDIIVSEKIQSINSLFFDKLMWNLTLIGNKWTMSAIIFCTGIVFYLFKFKKEAIFCTISTGIGALVGQIIKILVNRPRPTPDLIRVSSTLTDKSYPSGHVLVFTIFFGFMLFLLHKKVKNFKFSSIIPSIILIFLITMIGISRIYLGAHWASDVLGGYLLGILWLICTIRIYNSYNGKR